MSEPAARWTTFIAGPFIWFGSLSLGLSATPAVCAGVGRSVVITISVVALLLSAAATLYSWLQWKRVSERYDQIHGPGIRVVAIGSLVLNAAFFLVILVQSFPSFAATPCT